MDTRLRLGLVGIAMLVLASCSYPSESEVMERLAATETAAAEVIEIALGVESIGAWERYDVIGLLGEEMARLGMREGRRSADPARPQEELRDG